MYPKAVEDFLDQIEQGLQEENFYQEGSPGNDTDSQTVRKEFGKVVFSKWTQSPGGEIFVTEQEFMGTMQRCCAQSAINSLVAKGLVDVIEDSNGEEVVFMTEVGKQYMADRNGGIVPPSALSAQKKF